MKWIEATLRKGTKTPRLCRDMFINDHRGKFVLCKMMNGKIVLKQDLTPLEAKELLLEHKLEKIQVMFAGCYTYRTQKSNELINKLLNT